jgi:hypothetical protein
MHGKLEVYFLPPAIPPLFQEVERAGLYIEQKEVVNKLL